MIVEPATRGVVLFPCVASKGTCHSNVPLARSRPTRFLAAKVTSCFLPPTVSTPGEEFAEPSPFDFHLGSPPAKSKAMTTPLVPSPTWTIQRPSTTRGDMEESDLVEAPR